MTIGERIKALRKEHNMTQLDLAKKCGYTSLTSINKIELGINNIPISIVEKIANAFNVTPSYILGWENHTDGDLARKSPLSYAGAMPVGKPVRLPVVGTIRAGVPINMEQGDWEDYEWADDCDIRTHIFFRVSGESMMPTIPNGALALIRLQNYAESGQVVVFATDNENATLKRFRPQSNGIILLQADNPQCESYSVTQSDFETNNAHIIGVVEKIVVKM